ncbi:MAG: hypothetical protein ACKVP3_11130 [Hyphomicrobiaceae bacterium]
MDKPVLTPVAEKLRHELDERFDQIDRDKLTRWMMVRASNNEKMEIIDCRGRPISPGIGQVFDNQLRKIFWGFVRPCIEDAVHDACNQLETAFQRYSPEQIRGTLVYVEVLLQGFAHRIYGRMKYLDRAMRGGGYPESVEPYDPKREIDAAHRLIAYKLGVLRRHYAADLPAPADTQPKLGEVVSSKVRLFGVELDVANGWKWLKGRWSALTKHIGRTG